MCCLYEQMLGGHYINALMDYKEVHEVIFRRQCEHRMMDMHIEDQLTMKNSVLKLKLFEEEKDVSAAIIRVHIFSFFFFSSLDFFP